jgi:hypothetical protein
MGKKKAAKKSKPKEAGSKQKEVEKQEEKPFDFGGIPNRDLKKNLGCG